MDGVGNRIYVRYCQHVPGKSFLAVQTGRQRHADGATNDKDDHKSHARHLFWSAGGQWDIKKVLHNMLARTSVVSM